MTMPILSHPSRPRARRGRRARLAAALVLAAAFGACFSEAPSTTGPSGEVGATLEMNPHLRFDPATVTIKAGQAVRWKNTASFVHTATADPQLAQNAADVALPAGAQPFNSGDLTQGGEYVHTFTVPGVYKYFCLPHESFGMVGTVIVEAD
jgi:plastocyanin